MVDPTSAPTPTLDETPRTSLRRHAERGSFDRAAADAIIDEAYLAHVGFVVEGTPRVLPMTYGRIGDQLYLHGAVGNAMLRAAIGAEVCVEITLLDGLVLARSAFHHSMNFRSVVLIGTGTKVEDPQEKAAALDAIVDHVLPGRSQTARRTNDAELRSTLVVRVPIQEGSVKVRAGGALDEEGDLGLPVWAGVVPIATVPGDAEHDPLQAADPALAGLEPPAATRP